MPFTNEVLGEAREGPRTGWAVLSADPAGRRASLGASEGLWSPWLYTQPDFIRSGTGDGCGQPCSPEAALGPEGLVAPVPVQRNTLNWTTPEPLLPSFKRPGPGHPQGHWPREWARPWPANTTLGRNAAYLVPSAQPWSNSPSMPVT